MLVCSTFHTIIRNTNKANVTQDNDKRLQTDYRDRT